MHHVPLIEAQPVRGLTPADCDFYHRFDIPGLGESPGPWDLRAGAADYLGNVPLAGKSVLEIGPASGFLSFWMEQQGATVTCLEPELAHFWDLVPTANADVRKFHGEFRHHIARIRNSFWFAHEALGSNVQVMHGSAYSLPDDFGPFDVAVLSSVLLHTRLPLQIIAQCAKVTSGAIVVTERHDPALGEGAVMRFEPVPNSVDTWWCFTPQLIARVLAVYGFSNARVGFHRQPHFHDGKAHEIALFTTVAEKG